MSLIPIIRTSRSRSTIIRVQEKLNLKRTRQTRIVSLESRHAENLLNLRNIRWNLRQQLIPWTWEKAKASWSITNSARNLFYRTIRALICPIRIMICKMLTMSLKETWTKDPRKSRREVTTGISRRVDIGMINRAPHTTKWRGSCSIKRLVDNRLMSVLYLPRTINNLYHPVKIRTKRKNSPRRVPKTLTLFKRMKIWLNLNLCRLQKERWPSMRSRYSLVRTYSPLSRLSRKASHTRSSTVSRTKISRKMTFW